jgi:hypothetical protein
MLNRMNRNTWDINDWVSLRHRPHVPRFHGCRASSSFDLFDWVIWSPMDEEITRFEIKEPKKILCLTTPESVNLLLENASFTSKPSVVFAGEDTLLSTFIDSIDQIADRFSNIFYEAKDIDSDVVKSFSMGFTSFYLRDSVYENIYRAIEYSDQVPKSSLVLAAWGERWRFLDNTITDRKKLDRFLENSDITERKFIPFAKYWQELAKYKFLLAPRGQGVQAPRLAEAWMVKTLPVVTVNPTFIDLKDLGYPLILLDDWTEVTAENLDVWSGYYETIDWKQVRYKLTNSYLNELLQPMS